MYRVTVESQFQASHQLRLSDGLEDLHSHNWLVAVAAESETLNEFGFAVDFNELKKIMDQEIAKLGDGKIEDSDCFEGIASAENIAKYLFISIKKRINSEIKLKYVEVTEAPGCKAQYRE